MVGSQFGHAEGVVVSQQGQTAARRWCQLLELLLRLGHPDHVRHRLARDSGLTLDLVDRLVGQDVGQGHADLTAGLVPRDDLTGTTGMTGQRLVERVVGLELCHGVVPLSRPSGWRRVVPLRQRPVVWR
jgi:hypothetical protein